MQRSCISCCRAAGRKRGDGMSDVIKDVLMGKLFGGSGTSSGGGSSGGGWPEVPNDGATYLYITLVEGRTSPMMGVCVNGTMTVDWGDGAEPDVVTGTDLGSVIRNNHVYSTPGDYVIRLAVDGEIGFGGATGTNKGAYILVHGNGADSRNASYQSSVKSVVLGENVQLRYYAFYGCHGLDSIVWGKNGSFNSTSQFRECKSLKIVDLRNSDVINIASQSFYDCPSLARVLFPSSLLQIESNAFGSCGGVDFYDFTACTAVPTLAATSALSSIPDDCEIRVPAALYDEWIAATNWATYADYIKAY